jgi:hypothetical protein
MLILRAAQHSAGFEDAVELEAAVFVDGREGGESQVVVVVAAALSRPVLSMLSGSHRGLRRDVDRH